MKKFEYRFEKINPKWNLNQEHLEQEVLGRLNQLGEEGWEFISIEYKFGALFKREIDED